MKDAAILTYTGIKGSHYGEVTINYMLSEGYPTGEFVIRGLSRKHLQAFADWAITLPAEIYDGPIGQTHRQIERYLLEYDATGQRRTK